MRSLGYLAIHESQHGTVLFKNRKWGGRVEGCLLSLFIKVSIVAQQNSELYILTSFTQDIKKLCFLKDFWNSAQAAFNSRGPLVCILEIKFSLYQCALAMKSFFVLIEIICFQFSDKLIELSSDSGAFWLLKQILSTCRLPDEHNLISEALNELYVSRKPMKEVFVLVITLLLWQTRIKNRGLQNIYFTATDN